MLPSSLWLCMYRYRLLDLYSLWGFNRCCELHSQAPMDWVSSSHFLEPLSLDLSSASVFIWWTQGKQSKYQTAATFTAAFFFCKLAWLVATPLIFVNQVFVWLVRTVVLFENFTYLASDKMCKDDGLSDMSFVNLAIAMILWLVFKCHGCRNMFPPRLSAWHHTCSWGTHSPHWRLPRMEPVVRPPCRGLNGARYL